MLRKGLLLSGRTYALHVEDPRFDSWYLQAGLERTCVLHPGEPLPVSVDIIELQRGMVPLKRKEVSCIPKVWVGFSDEHAQIQQLPFSVPREPTAFPALIHVRKMIHPEFSQRTAGCKFKRQPLFYTELLSAGGSRKRGLFQNQPSFYQGVSCASQTFCKIEYRVLLA